MALSAFDAEGVHLVEDSGDAALLRHRWRDRIQCATPLEVEIRLLVVVS